MNKNWDFEHQKQTYKIFWFKIFYDWYFIKIKLFFQELLIINKYKFLFILNITDFSKDLLKQCYKNYLSSLNTDNWNEQISIQSIVCIIIFEESNENISYKYSMLLFAQIYFISSNIFRFKNNMFDFLIFFTFILYLFVVERYSLISFYLKFILLNNESIKNYFILINDKIY